MTKYGVRIGFQQGCETGRRIGPVGEVTRDEMIVRSGSFGAGDRDGEAAGIEVHGVEEARVTLARPCLGREFSARAALNCPFPGVSSATHAGFRALLGIETSILLRVRKGRNVRDHGVRHCVWPRLY